jgi:AcrR family transcriptional regulator
MTQVAERAGVTKAKIYRNYPTKEALIDAVTRHQFHLLESRTRAALSEPDAYEAFAAYIIDLFEWMADDRPSCGRTVRGNGRESGTGDRAYESIDRRRQAIGEIATRHFGHGFAGPGVRRSSSTESLGEPRTQRLAPVWRHDTGGASSLAGGPHGLGLTSRGLGTQSSSSPPAAVFAPAHRPSTAWSTPLPETGPKPDRPARWPPLRAAPATVPLACGPQRHADVRA